MSIDIERILEEIKILPELVKEQICLQGAIDNNDPYLGCYGLRDILNKGYKEKDFTEPLFDIPYTNQIIKKFKLYRTRILNLLPKTCYSYHYDISKRFHIPLITNKNCFMIIGKKISHYPADGNGFIIDTTIHHTAVNASSENRIHIVGCI